MIFGVSPSDSCNYNFSLNNGIIQIIFENNLSYKMLLFTVIQYIDRKNEYEHMIPVQFLQNCKLFISSYLYKLLQTQYKKTEMK